MRHLLTFAALIFLVTLHAQSDDPPVQSKGEAVVRFEENGKYGYRTYSGKITVEALYDQLSEEPAVFMPVRKDGKKGIINFQGEVIVPFGKYDNIQQHQTIPLKRGAMKGVLYFQDPENVGFLATKAGKHGLINPAGMELTPLKFSDFKYIFLNAYALLEGEQWGIYSSTGKQLQPSIYEFVGQAHLWDSTVIVTKAGKQGLLKLPDLMLLQPDFDLITNTPREKYKVAKGGINGVFDPATNTIAWTDTSGGKPLEPSPFLGYSGKYYRIYNPNTFKYGVGHPEKGVVLEAKFTTVGAPVLDSLFQCSLGDEKYALYDLKGNALSTPIYVGFIAAENGQSLILAMQKDNRWTLLNTKGKPVTGETYHSIQYEHESGYFLFNENAKFAVGKPDGARLTEFKYAFPGNLHPRMTDESKSRNTLKEGRKLVALLGLENGKWICIDNEGEEVICTE